MSLFVVGMMAAMGVVAGLIATLSEQIRVEVKRRRSEASEQLQQHQPDDLTQQFASIAPPKKSDTDRTNAVTLSHEDRAVAYRSILDSFGDDLDRDIAEWEAVLEEFPQVLLASDSHSAEERPDLQVTEETCMDRLTDAEKTVAPKRSRRIDPEEQGQIVRLSNTGFAPEEIALWLNLPLERVQELVSRP